jgi:hypothetical protein
MNDTGITQDHIAGVRPPVLSAAGPGILKSAYSGRTRACWGAASDSLAFDSLLYDSSPCRICESGVGAAGA